MGSVITILIAVFFLWIGQAAWKGRYKNSPAQASLRILMIFLSALGLFYAARFEWLQQWPEITLRPSTFFLSFPHSFLNYRLLSNRQI
ncbi:MAG: hypothetical protein ACYCYP_06650 [Leptospirales bacterium]